MKKYLFPTCGCKGASATTGPPAAGWTGSDGEKDFSMIRFSIRRFSQLTILFPVEMCHNMSSFGSSIGTSFFPRLNILLTRFLKEVTFWSGSESGSVNMTKCIAVMQMTPDVLKKTPFVIPPPQFSSLIFQSQLNIRIYSTPTSKHNTPSI